jgi:antitoxin component YwqK of YwqJK toxin-antitoxin module
MIRVDHDELEPTDDHLSLTYKDKPFTGIGYECDDNGNLISEICYKEGQKDGVTKEWFVNGKISLEENYRNNTLHGSCRKWYEIGVLESEEIYELGICVRRKVWSEDGTEIENYLIDENSPQFDTLQKLRQSTVGKHIMSK